MLLREKFINLYLYLYLYLYSVCISSLFDLDGRNWLLIFFMMISSTILLIKPIFLKTDSLIVIFIATITLFPLFFYDFNTRWSTVLYSVLFCLSFMGFQRFFFFSSITLDSYINVLKTIIYLYFIVLCLQQICVLLNLPIINIRNYQVNDIWKLNSLGAEPSWSGRIVAVLMYSYISMWSLKDKYCSLISFIKKNKKLSLVYLWIMLSMGSATALLFLLFTLLVFIRAKSFIYITPLICCFSLFISFFDSQNLDRIITVISSISSYDPETIYQADSSASARILPLIVILKNIGFTTFNDFFGYGVDFIKNNIDLGFGVETSGGVMISIAIEYGLISFLLYLSFTLQFVDRKDFVNYVFWFFLVFMYGLNTQIPWLALMLFFINNQFRKHIKTELFS